MKRYYYLLDGARFLAAFWVMNFHYLFGDGPSSDLHWYRFGNLGVQVFFIVSGFVIVQSLKGKTLSQFAWGRFIRLFPLFWVVCTFTYILTIFLPDIRYSLELSNYLRSMTMLSDALQGLLGPALLIDPSYWTLTVEIIFYAGIALFVRFFSYNNIRFFLLAWLVTSMATFALHNEATVLGQLLLVRHASYFIFGAALAMIAAGDMRSRFDQGLVWALLGASAIYATYIHPRAIPAYISSHPYDATISTGIHILFFIGIPALVYLSRYVHRPVYISMLAILGGLTYPLYLIHQRIGNIMIDQAVYFTTISWVILVVCVQIIMIGAAYYLFALDKRFRDWVLRKQIV